MPDRRVGMMGVWRSSCMRLNRDQSSALPSNRRYYVIYPLKFSLFNKIVFFDVFYAVKTDKPDRHAWSVYVRFRMSGMPVEAWLSAMSDSRVWPAWNPEAHTHTHTGQACLSGLSVKKNLMESYRQKWSKLSIFCFLLKKCLQVWGHYIPNF